MLRSRAVALKQSWASFVLVATRAFNIITHVAHTALQITAVRAFFQPLRIVRFIALSVSVIGSAAWAFFVCFTVVHFGSFRASRPTDHPTGRATHAV